MNTPSKVLFAALAVAAFALTSPAISAPDFYHDYSSGVAAAQSKDKPMVVVFSASWCGPCQQMKQSVYPSSAVAPYHDDFVWVYLDVDDPKNAETVRQHRVGPIPHVSFKNSSGKAVDTLKGSVRPSDFADRLEKVQKKTGATQEAPTETQAPAKKNKLFNLFKRDDSV